MEAGWGRQWRKKDFFFEKKKQKTFGYWTEPIQRRTP
jgi:hypothetical protein